MRLRTVCVIYLMLAAALLLTIGASQIVGRVAACDGEIIPGNPGCGDCNCGGSEFKIENSIGSGSYSDSKAGLTVTLSITGSDADRVIAWNANRPVHCVIVKGGDQAMVYRYNPPATGGSGLHAPDRCGQKNNRCGISHISFCYTPCSVSVDVTPGEATLSCAQPTALLTAHTSAPAPSYQWYSDGAKIDGATGSTYSANQAGSYYVIVSSGGCSDESDHVTVTEAGRPTVSITPAGGELSCTTSQVTLTASASDATSPSFQWYQDGAKIDGATGSGYAATAAGTYRVQISEGSCTADSNEAIVTEAGRPTVSITPAGGELSCTTSQVTLTASASDATSPSYQWYKDGAKIDGATGSGYAATAAGSYWVVITAGSCTAESAHVTVTQLTRPTVTVAPTGGQLSCTTSEVLLSANAGGATSVAYQWYKDGAKIDGATGSTYPATQPGSHRVRVTAGDCSADSGEATITRQGGPTVSVSPTSGQITCTVGQVVLTATVSGAASPSYQWYQDGAAISGANSASHTATQSGAYWVVIAEGNCTATSNQVAVTRVDPPTVVVYASSGQLACGGGTVLLTAAVTGALSPSYQWYLDGAPISGANGSAYTAGATGSYHVLVTAGDCSGESNHVTLTRQGGPAVSVTPAGGQLTCTVNQVLLTAAVSGATPTGYQWYRDGAPIAGANGSTYTATTSGTFYVVVSAGNCAGESNHAGVTREGGPTVTVNPPVVELPCPSGQATLSATVAGPAPSGYQWYKDGAPIAGATGSSYTAGQAGIYWAVVYAGTCAGESNHVSVLGCPPEPCTVADVAVVIRGGPAGMPVRAWLDGAEQATRLTAPSGAGQSIAFWSFYPAAGTSPLVQVEPQLPAGYAAPRWQLRLVQVQSPTTGLVINGPGAAAVNIAPCNRYILTYDLVDTQPQPGPAPVVLLPVTGGDGLQLLNPEWWQGLAHWLLGLLRIYF